MESIIMKVTELKNKIKQAEEARNKLEGKKDHLMSELQKGFNVTSIDEAKGKLQDLGVSLQELEDTIRESVHKLETEIDDVR